jgi:hypothetical protein
MLKMANKLSDGSYACSVCGENYGSMVKADRCREQHDMLYIPMSRSELNLLLHAIVLEDVSAIPDSLRLTLEKYQRASFRA